MASLNLWVILRDELWLEQLFEVVTAPQPTSWTKDDCTNTHTFKVLTSVLQVLRGWWKSWCVWLVWHFMDTSVMKDNLTWFSEGLTVCIFVIWVLRSDQSPNAASLSLIFVNCGKCCFRTDGSSHHLLISTLCRAFPLVSRCKYNTLHQELKSSSIVKPSET